MTEHKQEREKALVDRCLAGEERAWMELVEKYHRALAYIIAKMLGRKRRDLQSVDEIAADIWASLIVPDHGLLAAFNPQRAALITFLSILARRAIQIRKRTRRRRREVFLKDQDLVDKHAESEPLSFSLEQALESLPPKSKQFCQEQIADYSPFRRPLSGSRSNCRKLKERSIKKLSCCDPTNKPGSK